MSQPHVIKQFAGLFASTNAYAIAPEGSLELADECVIRSQAVLSSRRGHAAVAIGAQISAIGFKEGFALAMSWDNAATGVTGQLRAVNLATGVVTALPMVPGALPFASPGGLSAFTRFISTNKAVYFQSRYGLTKIETVAAGSRCAIQPPGVTGAIGMLAVLGTGGPINWLKAGFQVAYRFTICRHGANNEVIESEPSERIILQNTTGSAGFGFLSLLNGYMVPPDAFLRVYRTIQVANTGTPNDELFLVTEQFLNQTVDANGYCLTSNGIRTVTYNDVTDDGQGAQAPSPVPLYTNPSSGDGIDAANTSAPIALDMAYFKNRLLLLNTIGVQLLAIKIIGTGAGGILDGDSILIAGARFTFRTTAVHTNDVVLSTGGTVAQNIENTARALETTVNNWFGSNFATTVPAIPLPSAVLARYVSTGGVDIGQVVLQRLVPGADPFTVQTSSANGWDSDYTTGANSDPSAQAAGISWSPADEPESAPPENKAIVGDASSAGQRIIPLKQAALIFKQDGLFVWTDDGSGSNTGVAITTADPTVRLLAPETAQAVDNYALGLCDQGVLLFSEQGNRVDVSFDQVNRELQKLIAAVSLPTLAKVAFAVAYQPEHEYILCLPESPNAASCTLQYVYNLQTKTWTRWRLPGVVAGAVDPVTGKLIWSFASSSNAPAAAGNLWVERKNGDSTDYQDPGFTIACPASSSTASMVFTGDRTSGPTAFAVGDVVQQPQPTYFLQQRVKSVTYLSGANQTAVVFDAAPSHPWSSGQVLTVLKAIQCAPKFLPFHAGEPLTVKQWGDIYFAFRYLDLDWITYTWVSELATTPAATEQVTGTSLSAEPKPPILEDLFGSQPFGVAAWDRQTKDVIIKTTLPQEIASCALLTLQLGLAGALARWELCAIDAKVEGATPEPVR